MTGASGAQQVTEQQASAGGTKPAGDVLLGGQAGKGHEQRQKPSGLSEVAILAFMSLGRAGAGDTVEGKEVAPG